jgi:AcrR family transcriptional regulator
MFSIMKRQNSDRVSIRFGTKEPSLSGISLPFHGSGDRRTVRTQILLRQSLFSLMAERDYDAITVQNILERANIGRSTFYAHFSSKDELLNVCLEMFNTWLSEAQNQARSRAASADELFGFTLALFEHLAEQRELFKRITSHRSGAEIVRRALEKNITAAVRRDLAASQRLRPTQPDALETSVAAASGALYSLAVWWLSSRSKLTASDVNQTYRHFIQHGLKQPIEALRH